MRVRFCASPHSRVQRAARLLLATLAGALACERAPAPHPGLEVDVARYVARVQQWARMERDVSAASSRLFRSHFLDHELAIAVTGDLGPSIDAHVETLTAYAPETPEVGRIHTRYARAWRRLREGFRLINQGMREDDAQLLAQGRRRIEVWQEEMLNVGAALQALVEKVGLDSTKAAAMGPRGARSLPRGPHLVGLACQRPHALQNVRMNAV